MHGLARDSLLPRNVARNLDRLAALMEFIPTMHVHEVLNATGRENPRSCVLHEIVIVELLPADDLSNDKEVPEEADA